MIYDKYEIFPIAILFIEKKKMFSSFNEYLNKNGKWNYQIDKLDFYKITKPPKISGYFPKLVLWTPKNNKSITVIFSNVSDGFTNPINNFCIKENVNVIDVTFNGMDRKSNAGKYEFRYGKMVRGKQQERVLQYLKDTVWEYYEEGDKLDFEKQEDFTHYTLSNEILKDYLKYFNININDSFFESHDDAYFFEQIEWSNEDFDVDDILGEINKE